MTDSGPDTPADPPADESAVDCYSAGDRGLMVWGQRLRARLLAPLLWLLARCRISANALTLAAMLAGLAFYPAYFHSPAVALGLLALHVCLDGLDGPLARYTGKASSKGSFTDTMGDQVVVAASTITLIADGLVGVVPGGVYVFVYTVVIAFSMIRNALRVPYSWLVRPRLIVYAWFAVELYLLPGTIDTVLWAFTALLMLKMITGFVTIRKHM